MPVDRWRALERLYHEALDQDEAARQAFLGRACAGDPEMLEEVQSLLRLQTEADRFLSRPALEQIAAPRTPQAAESLVGRQVHGYDVRALLGAGGMGEVYLATDLRLGRDVALKVLRPSVAADPGYLQRLEDEARSASVLNHPNIVTIYGVGDDGDIRYIAMERVNGRTLREIVASADLAISVVLDLAVQLAEALAVAHANGIVHRDLKPDNVMVTPEGLLKVLDFGIAKREGRVEARANSVSAGQARVLETAVGTLLGTVEYMSPEQATGQRAGPASDQFSFGSILYELLTGRRAFERRTRTETLEAIKSGQPAPIETLNANATSSLRRLLQRCLEKDPARRFSDTRLLVHELRSIRGRLDGGGLSRRQMLAFGAAASVAAAAGLMVWRRWPSGPRVQSMAVLPFRNGANDPGTAHLADGLTRSLIERIAPLPAVRVTAFSLVSNFRGTDKDPRAIGRELEVESVLSGAITQQAGRLSIAAELAEVATGKLLWSNVYDRPASDLLIVQDDIAQAIVSEGIRLQLTDDERRRLTARDTNDPIAYDLYLRARYAHEGETEADYLRERDFLQQALARDPGFARAYAKLAGTYSVMAVDGYESPADAGRGHIANVRQALMRDADLPDAYAEAASWEFFFDWKWQNAESEWGRAMRARGAEIDPELLTGRALQQWALGRSDNALRFVRQARALDGLSPSLMITEADYLVQGGQLDEAEALYESASRAQRAGFRAYAGIAEVRRRQGRFDEAIEARRLGYGASSDDSMASVLSAARGQAGYERIDRETARLQMEGLRERGRSGAYVSPTDLGRVCARLGDRTQALRYLDAAIAERSPQLVFLNVDRYWDSVRTAPTFVNAIKQVGLPL